MRRLWSGARRFRTVLGAQSLSKRSPGIARCFSAAPCEARRAAAGVSAQLKQLQADIEADPQKCGEAMKNWYAQGNSLAQQQVTDMFESMSYSNQRGALRLMQFIIEEQPALELSTHAYVRYMRLGARFYEAATAENIYRKIPASRVTEELTAAFLTILLRKAASFRAEKIARGLPEPRTPGLWEAVISIYSELDMHEKMLESFSKLRKSGLEPTLLTLVHMLKLQSRLGGLPGLQEESREAAGKVDLEMEKDQWVLIPAMEIYSMLGDGEMVKKYWEVIKSCEVVLHESFVSAIRCLGQVGEIDRAEGVLQELLQMKCRRGNPYMKLADAYARLGLVEKAEEIVREKIPESFIFNSLIIHYLRHKMVDKGVKMAKKQVRKGMSYEAVVLLLPALETRRDVSAAKAIVGAYLINHHGDVKVLNGLLKVYAAAGVGVDKFLMEHFEMVEPDEETMLLLASLPLEEAEESAVVV